MFAPEIPAEFLNQWLTLDKCRQLAEYMAVPELDKANKNTNRTMTWNKLKEYLPALGYSVEQKRKKIDGKIYQCYYITGQWHDVELVDNSFLQLAEARMQLADDPACPSSPDDAAPSLQLA